MVRDESGAGVQSLKIPSGLVVVAGLGSESAPYSFLRLWVESDGRKASKLETDKNYIEVVEINNRLSRSIKVIIQGEPLAGQTFSLAAGEVKRIETPAIPIKKEFRSSVNLKIEGLPSQRADVILPVVESNIVTRAPQVAAESEIDFQSAAPLYIRTASQRVPDIYDLKTGIGWEGTTDLSAVVQLMWTPVALHVLTRVRDDVVAPSPSGKPWDGDDVEVFLDARGLDAGNADYGAQVYHFHAKAPLSKEKAEIALSGKVPEGTKAYGWQLASGYVVEITIPARGFGGGVLDAGKTFGFDVAVDDTDDPSGKGGRRTQMILFGNSTNDSDASGFGRFKLR